MVEYLRGQDSTPQIRDTELDAVRVRNTAKPAHSQKVFSYVTLYSKYIYFTWILTFKIFFPAHAGERPKHGKACAAQDDGPDGKPGREPRDDRQVRVYD